ncbi:hypothetical protein BASA61_003032 [Batrachochytrium salamandrivorans]|nr:hypothetical protein BASA61_003032 [Batrachochytrium salamandrivorans]
MKLAIASTTLLFAMMTAQATVLSVAPVTGVNLVKRAPNGGDDDEQSTMVDQSSSDPTPQPLSRNRKKNEWMISMVSFVATQEKITKLEEELKTSQEEYRTKLDEQAGIEEAMRLDDHDI